MKIAVHNYFQPRHNRDGTPEAWCWQQQWVDTETGNVLKQGPKRQVPVNGRFFDELLGHDLEHFASLTDGRTEFAEATNAGFWRGLAKRLGLPITETTNNTYYWDWVGPRRKPCYTDMLQFWQNFLEERSGQGGPTEAWGKYYRDVQESVAAAVRGGYEIAWSETPSAVAETNGWVAEAMAAFKQAHPGNRLVQAFPDDLISAFGRRWLKFLHRL